MDLHAAREIIACLPEGRTLFYYFRGRYALMLLSYAVGDGVPVARLKQTRYAKLLAKPVVKDVLRRVGDGILTADALQALWPRESECYLLTLDTWGSKGDRWANWHWDQTSRRGVNLVLQLNFSSEHNRLYERFIQPTEHHPFVCRSHPICEDGHQTLAWSRIDLDFGTGEALIEEIQSDWIKNALRKQQTLATVERDGLKRHRWARWTLRDVNCDLKAISTYIERALRRHMGIWPEAMLAATIWFLREELGLRRIFYHTHESGARLKRIASDRPPKSLYTTLPRQFLFEETSEAPAFLRRSKDRHLREVLRQAPRFHRLIL